MSLLTPLKYLLVLIVLTMAGGLRAESDIVRHSAVGADFQSARDALVESIESEGLVVSASISFNDMLTRTAKEIGKGPSPYTKADVIQFCTTRIAWKLVEEAPENVALCPVSIVVYETVAKPGEVVIAFRAPARVTTARNELDALMQKIVDRAINLARQRW
jgi:uncharacterized protein (DUF302 family)